MNARSGIGNGSTPIFDASPHKDQLDLLLRSGADINARSNNGDTVLIRDAMVGGRSARNLLADVAPTPQLWPPRPAPKTALSLKPNATTAPPAPPSSRPRSTIAHPPRNDLLSTIYLGAIHNAREEAPTRIPFGLPPALDEF